MAEPYFLRKKSVEVTQLHLENNVLRVKIH